MSRSINAPAWLTARPIAHRGLHDRALTIPENTLAAAQAAITAGYAIECDVQLSSDGEAMVFHDAALGRLTEEAALVADTPAAALGALTVAGSAERIPTLSDYLDAIHGAVPLIVEIKSRFSSDLRLTQRVAEVVSGYDGPVAVKSFDPGLVTAFAALAPEVPRGIVAETTQDDPAYAAMPETQRRSLAELLHFGDSRPDFLSWRVDDLPCAATSLCRLLGGLPVMTWTVRNPGQRRLAEAHADQMVFEGFRP